MTGTAAVVDELVLLHPAPPDLLLDQRPTRAAVHADLALLAELVDAVVHRIIVCHRASVVMSISLAREPKCGDSNCPFAPKLPKSCRDEHRYVGRAIVVWAVDLRVIALLPNVRRELEAHGALDLVRAEVRELRVEAGDGLSLPVVLLKGEADRVLVLDPLALALVGVVTVESGEAHLAEPQLARPQPDRLGHLFAELRRAGRLDLAETEAASTSGLLTLSCSSRYSKTSGV